MEFVFFKNLIFLINNFFLAKVKSNRYSEIFISKIIEFCDINGISTRKEDKSKNYIDSLSYFFIFLFIFFSFNFIK